ncbi:MAG TPA: hypothetical protein VEI57_06155 [Nitrospirota bacterium]|nr:hypothetical protein [Nitrospirota bacterium]
MCVDYSLNCSCGKTHASFNFRDEVLPFNVVTKLYCPACSREVTLNPATMVADNGWVIEYDMEVARFMMQKKAPVSTVKPEFLFDEGYCTWRGMTPTDHIDSVKERAVLVQIAKSDPKRYFEEIKSWGNNRMERLAREGWRKAIEREPAKA